MVYMIGSQLNYIVVAIDTMKTHDHAGRTPPTS
jgi:hypothetical protein